MEKETQKIITELMTNFNLSAEFLAIKFSTTTRTIERWKAGDNEPPEIAMKYIRQVYNGYKNQAQK